MHNDMQQMYNISFTKKNKQKRPTKASDYGRRHNGMVESTVTADSKLTSSDTRRRIWAIVGASSGNLVEWFDFYVYSFCSLYFAHISSLPGTRRLNYYKQQVFLLRDS